MEQLVKNAKPISTEMREEILVQLRNRFPHELFRGYWDSFLKAHVVEVSNYKFSSSREYVMTLGELSEKYLPEHDILLEIYFTGGKFTTNNITAGLRKAEAATVIIN